MADNIVAGLFGLSPEMYGEQQRRSALQEGITLANLDPAARGAAMTYAGARGLGTAIGGAMGIEDPQLKLISLRNSIAQQIDQTNPESILQGAQMLAQAGDQQGAMAMADFARKAQVQIAEQQQRVLAGEASLAAKQASLAAASRERFQADPFQKLVESGKYTPASLAEYQRTGLPADLVLYEKPEKPEKPDSKTTIQKLQEYAATLPPGSPLLAQVQAAISAEGQSRGTKVEVKLPESQKAEQGERGKSLTKDFFENVSPTARNAQKNLPAITSNLNILDKGFETGFGTETAASAAKVLAALGVQGAEKFASNSQIFLANANQAVLSKQLEQKGTQTKTDAERIEQTGARLGNTKEANKFILTVAREQLQRDIEQRDFYAKWYRTNTTYDGAEDAWFDGKGSESLFDRPALKQYGVSASKQIPTNAPSASTVGIDQERQNAKAAIAAGAPADKVRERFKQKTNQEL
jgi:hypothetical protein